MFRDDIKLSDAIDPREIPRIRKIIAGIYKSDDSLWHIRGSHYLSFTEAFKIRAFHQLIEKVIATL